MLTCAVCCQIPWMTADKCLNFLLQNSKPTAWFIACMLLGSEFRRPMSSGSTLNHCRDGHWQIALWRTWPASERTQCQPRSGAGLFDHAGRLSGGPGTSSTECQRHRRKAERSSSSAGFFCPPRVGWGAVPCGCQHGRDNVIKCASVEVGRGAQCTPVRCSGLWNRASRHPPATHESAGCRVQRHSGAKASATGAPAAGSPRDNRRSLRAGGICCSGCPATGLSRRVRLEHRCHHGPLFARIEKACC